ncbi:Prolylcarboxypeptidase (angiotensinase C) (ISS) [Dorcoceras hygrometricum]|uniref:Prolylcarboxypeptidase (Angiotensinase C) (ISS) n=1 Tax=Dorcoceras hygrometricum TaxID=472368 RepID=A0A2Z7A416_9LAMI|nr:Prolylcarboxypeptidase (angiotensinase C) (ISS) [Dorcoceras hygrometricum]
MGNTDPNNTKAAYIETIDILQQKPAVSLNKNQQQPTDVAFAKENQNDAASTNQNDAVALQYLTTDFFPNNQQLLVLNNSNEIVKDTSPLLPTADQKHYTQNAAFQLNKTTSPLISDWFLKPTAGHSAWTIPHNATADSATIQQSTPKWLTNTCHFLDNHRTRATASSRHLFKRYY